MYKSFTLTQTSNIGLNVYQYGEERCAKKHSYGPAVRQHYLFHYVITGKGVLHTEFGAFPVLAGEGFLIYPHDITTYCADDREPWHYMWIEIDGLQAARLFDECHLSRAFPIYRPRTYRKDAEAGRRLQALVEHNQEQWATVLGLSYLFFAALIEHAQTDITHKEDDKTQHLKRAVKYIESRYHNTLTIEQLAQYCNLNRSYLSRLFKHEYGMSPKTYLLHFRMKIAASLLDSGTLAIKVVAVSVGYENQMHFSKAFRQVYGMSPLAWRHRSAGNG
ncbi:AraC family transcriptional regulator [Pectobacterium zantedeschiae]|uniref:Arabinose operon regulatory protein n=1 Tax=Pectobacterium zantedeschiae TaxID=2034769 RepID=A0A9X8JK39_9GAMM|nr:AraC family transcriptional regulator [Pectobacterium zantedeschiae]RYC38462.1 AraC family transcriptional regulator [Pectobacterium zantedeschiae]RYC45106.1 AraC family transcriptional regulator [Pectobacterium zantedeschiae]